MRAVRATVVIFAAAAAFSASPAALAQERTCPPEETGFVEYRIVGNVGDPVPAPGTEPIWDALVEVLASEGLTVEDLATLFGFDSVQELYEFVLTTWLRLDKNGDRRLCIQEFPSQGGQPVYFANFIDNNARVPD
jgi:hypothetical protein